MYEIFKYLIYREICKISANAECRVKENVPGDAGLCPCDVGKACNLQSELWVAAFLALAVKALPCRASPARKIAYGGK